MMKYSSSIKLTYAFKITWADFPVHIMLYYITVGSYHNYWGAAWGSSGPLAPPPLPTPLYYTCNRLHTYMSMATAAQSFERCARVVVIQVATWISYFSEPV